MPLKSGRSMEVSLGTFMSFMDSKITWQIAHSHPSITTLPSSAHSQSPPFPAVHTLNHHPSQQCTLSAINHHPSQQCTLSTINHHPSQQCTLSTVNHHPSQQFSVDVTLEKVMIMPPSTTFTDSHHTAPSSSTSPPVTLCG